MNKSKSFGSGLKALKNSVVSFEALQNIDQLLDEHEIAFAHLHIIHHWVTPAIIWKLKKRGIPVIWTLHEYKLLCPEGTFVSKDAVCEKCQHGRFYNCAIQRCKKGSFLGSVLASFDAYFYKFSKIYELVDAYLCPSVFLQRKFAQFGFQPEKLKLTNYCYDIAKIDQFREVNCQSKARVQDSPYIFFVGRIERLKGVLTLIKAVETTEMRLKIAGTGAALDEMKEYVRQHKLANVEFLGFQNKEDVYRLTMQSLFVVCPSEWYENYPFSVIESLLLEKSVVGSKMGGIPELIIDGKSGFLHEAGNHLDLREKMLHLWQNPALAQQMGKEARDFAYSKVNFNTHWQIIRNILLSLGINTDLRSDDNIDLVHEVDFQLQ